MSNHPLSEQPADPGLWSPVAKDLVRNMLYFEVFAYPVSERELWETSSMPDVTQEEIRSELDRLLDAGMVKRVGEWYATQDRNDWAVQREANNGRAHRYLKIASEIGPWIGIFPFVRAVFVSGSLSKGVMPEDGDIDYFVVTSPGRLWLARTMLVMFKKIFLLNSKKYWCVNYFVDEDHLTIEERNRFTATEVVTLLPVYGSDLYRDFLLLNRWVGGHFAQFPPRDCKQVPPSRSRWGKKIAEWLLDNRFGDWLDGRLMRSTVKHWMAKFEHLNPEEFSVALKSRKYVSKHHPQHFQRRVLDRYAALLEEYGHRNGVQL